MHADERESCTTKGTKGNTKAEPTKADKAWRRVGDWLKQMDPVEGNCESICEVLTEDLEYLVRTHAEEREAEAGIEPPRAQRTQREKRAEPTKAGIRVVLLEALRAYGCQYTLDADGDGVSLVDVLTPPGNKDISEGTAELELLADELAVVCANARAEEREPVTQECPGAGYPNKWNWHVCGADGADGVIRRYPTLLCPRCLGKGTEFDPLERLKVHAEEREAVRELVRLCIHETEDEGTCANEDEDCPGAVLETPTRGVGECDLCGLHQPIEEPLEDRIRAQAYRVKALMKGGQ